MERYLEVLTILISANQPLTVDKIAERLKVSNKTIRNDLGKVEEYLSTKKIQLIKKTGMGVMVEGLEEEKLNIAREIRNDKGVIEPYCPKNRKYYIIKRLLMAEKYITMQSIADELYVSRVTIHKDLTEVEVWLKKFELQLVSKTNHGIEVVGKEENWRNAVISLIAHDKEEDELKEMLYEHYGGRIDYKTLRKLKELIQIDYGQLEKIVTMAELKLKFAFSDEAYISLIIHIAIAIKRLGNKKDICLAEATLLKLKEKEEYQVAKEIGQDIGDCFNVQLPESEIGYILLHILGAKTQQSQTGDVHMELDEENNLAIVMAKEIIMIAQNVLSYDLSHDKQLLNGLILHLRPTINRLKYGLTLRNPILHEIQENYPEVYGVAWMTSIVFEKYVGCRANEEEIGYIALHIGAAVERAQKPFRALVVCTSGIGTSQLLAARLGRCFKEIEVKDVLSVTLIEEYITDDVDFIISTIPISSREVKKPVIQISPLLLQNDIKRLEGFIEQLSGKKREFSGGIMMLINENLVLLDMDVTTKEDAIRCLALAAQNAGKLSSLEEFTQSVLEREKTFSTGVGNGIAIPHGKSKDVKEVMIAFGKVRKGIEWDSYDGSPVTMIFLLGVPMENVDNVHLAILSQLSRKLMEEDFVESLNQATTIQAILTTLNVIQVDG
ncbi:BglG family transcription antiterminator [Pelosinus sp. sgz500959]|uniref:BglG family transcription antiterminator n=1 Tax=Pelosinus sp. sgz500959 TaxID=3242472 RepID=UPI00366F27F3